MTGRFNRCLAGLMLATTFVASAVDIEQGHSGTWWVPGVDGQGVLLEVFPESQKVFFTWYTYADGGKQRWLTGTGDISEQRASFSIQEPVGAVFDKPGEPDRPVWGTGTLEFSSCTQATLTFQTDGAEGDGVLNLERLTPNVSCGGGS